ncbi:hypothetical protein HDV00_009977 [Rhizophlyctis rosea]|nr:hypothetical protein HDV00_009977 [Rhizophlyctis rosea]
MSLKIARLLRPTSNLNLTARCPHHKPTISYTSIRNAVDPAKSKAAAAMGDPRYQLIKDMLYDRNVPTTKGVPFQKITYEDYTSPLPPQSDEFETKKDLIERAWVVVKKKEAVQRVAELRAKYECMRKAMEELKKTDTRLFEAAAQVDRETVTVFPRRLRIPTETPPLRGWDGGKPE